MIYITVADDKDELYKIEIKNNLSHKKAPRLANYDIKISGNELVKYFEIKNHVKDNGVNCLLAQVFKKFKF